MIRTRTLLLALAALLALLSVALVWYALSLRPPATQMSGASIGGPFVLIDQNGRTRSDADFRGRYVLLYFGYTWCPDVCPTTLQHIADALGRLGPKAERIVPVFVTVDPERDTPATLKKYVSAFGPQFVGLTGSRAAIAHIAQEYRVYFARQPGQGNAYTVSHSSALYLLAPDGKFVTFYESDMTADALAKDIESRL